MTNSIVFCPKCGTELKVAKDRKKFDNSRTCGKGHKFNVFIVTGGISVNGPFDDWNIEHHNMDSSKVIEQNRLRSLSAEEAEGNGDLQSSASTIQSPNQTAEEK